MCIHNPLECRKTCYKIIFRSEHAEDISSVYLLNQIFESISDLFAKEISKRIQPLLICDPAPVNEALCGKINFDL